MTKTIILRKAIFNDATDIADLYLASRKKFLVFAPLIHSDSSILSWIQEVLIPTGQVTVAEENGDIVGMMALSTQDKIGWIDQLYIAPVKVARGIGSLLVSEAKAVLGSPIRLRTFQQNTEARRFYERNGFRILEFSDGSTNEEKCPDILYEWRE